MAADIPCLWVESSGHHLVLHLPQEVGAVKKLLYRLVDGFRGAASFAEAVAGLLPSSGVLAAANARDHFLVSLHGIRTRGVWQKELNAAADRGGLRHRPFDFGWFRALQLILPPSRAKKVEWFLKEYQSLVREEQLGASPPSLIAHSFGTYVVARAMEKYPEIRFRRIIFCGSIVRRDYDWATMFARGQVERVLNDYGKKDMWVRIAEWTINDGGASGYQGFGDTADRLVQRMHEHWSHSDYFYHLNYSNNWIPFIAAGTDPVMNPPQRVRAANWRFRAVVLALVLLAIAVLAWRYLLR